MSPLTVAAARTVMARATQAIAAVAIAACMLPGMAGAAQAQERIVSYDSVVEVHADGSLDITEAIRVRAEGDAIRRGIYRDFPIRYRDRFGNRVVVGFEVLGVQRDGRPEPWFTERHANGVRINTGNDDFLRVPADYTYTLHYRTDRQLGFFDGFDELYFNGIGTGWAFPIERGSVEVRLPDPVPARELKVAGYTGGHGSRARDFTAAVTAPGVARWTLARPLAPGEGMTLVLSFPKGIVTAPTGAQRAWWLLKDNSAALIGLGGLVVLLVFCFLRWRKVGRDPPAGVVVVGYEPPDGYSAADLRFVKQMGYDNRCFTSELLANAVDGLVRIHRDKRLLKDTWRLERLAEPGNQASAGQHLLMKRLFREGPSLDLENDNASTLRDAMTGHAGLLEDRFSPRMFSRNARSVVVAVLIMVAALVLAVGIGVTWLGSGVLLLLPIGAAMLAVVIAFAVLVRAPTPAGRKLLDEIEGFRRYLGVAERDELATMQGPDAPPTLDAQRYERLLPYAVALDVEEAWTRKFTLAVGAAAAAATTSAITWYQGGGIDNLGRLSQTIGTGLTSQIASSATPPGSASGGGGGGFSGGGGGGGGGGGR